MGYGSPDPYYQPEAFGLEKVDEIDFSSGCYEFDLRVIWRHAESGKLYTARDSGCSCPSPFEDISSLEQLDLVRFDELESEAKSEMASEWRTQNGDIPAWLQSLRDLQLAGR